MGVEKLKLVIFLVISLGILGLLGYWAVRTLEPGDIHAERREISELREQNEELAAEVARLESELALLQPEETPEEFVEELAAPTETSPSSPATYKHQKLIGELETLIEDNIVMKEKSKGTRVGTVQNFLNLYHGTSRRVDNDFGKTTKDDLIKFQRAEGLTADGEAGPSTYRKMIDWLKKQG